MTSDSPFQRTSDIHSSIGRNKSATWRWDADEEEKRYNVDLRKFENAPDDWRKNVRGKAAAMLQRMGLKQYDQLTVFLKNLDPILAEKACTFEGFSDYINDVRLEWDARVANRPAPGTYQPTVKEDTVKWFKFHYKTPTKGITFHLTNEARNLYVALGDRDFNKLTGFASDGRGNVEWNGTRLTLGETYQCQIPLKYKWIQTYGNVMSLEIVEMGQQQFNTEPEKPAPTKSDSPFPPISPEEKEAKRLEGIALQEKIKQERNAAAAAKTSNELDPHLPRTTNGQPAPLTDDEKESLRKTLWDATWPEILRVCPDVAKLAQTDVKAAKGKAGQMIIDWFDTKSLTGVVEKFSPEVYNKRLGEMITFYEEENKNFPPQEQSANPVQTKPPVQEKRNDVPATSKTQPETLGDPVNAISLFRQITTLTGIPITEIGKRMNALFPDAAYAKIPYGVMAGKTDLSFEFVRDRFDEVFGTHGFGWKIEPHATLGNVDCTEEGRNRKDGSAYTKYIVTLTCHVLRYRIVLPDGSLQWEEVSVLSDSDENEDKGYAFRGAFTSLLKQYLRSFGGMNHILQGEYTHVDAQRNSSQSGKRAS